MDDQGPTVRAFLQSQAAVIDHAAKTLQPHLKQSVPLAGAPVFAVLAGDHVIYEVPLRDDAFTVKDGFMKLPKKFGIGEPAEVYVRVSYKRAFHNIFNSNYTFTHLSGDPGIGKSCLLWYFVSRLRQLGYSIVVQLVVVTLEEFYYFHGGKCVLVTMKAAQEYLRIPGTWLLIDERFTSIKNELGRAVLFAKPHRGNGAVEALKNMDEGYFTVLHMCAWKPAELLVLWNRIWQDDLQRTAYTLTGKERDFLSLPGYTSAAHFMARLYTCGGIVRHFRRSLPKALERTSEAVEYYVRYFQERVEYPSHRVFVQDPEHDMKGIREVKFVSPWCKKRFGQEFYRAKLEKRLNLLYRTKADLNLALFEDFAHERLSGGGEFTLSDGCTRITLPPADMKRHYGNSSTFTDSDRDKYVLPLSYNFPLVDAIAGGFRYLLQVSCGSKRRPMWKSDYDELVERCESIGQQKPIFMLVIPEGHCELPYTKLKTPRTDGDGQRKKQRLSYSTTSLEEAKQLILPRPETADAAPHYRLELKEVMDDMECAACEGQPLFDEEEDCVCEECGLYEGDEWWISCDECQSRYHRVCADPTPQSQFSCKLCRI